MVEKLANGNILFFKHDESKEERLFGYSKQFMASLGMALSVSQGGSLETLVLGYPRTGKTILPFAITHQLNELYKLNFSLTMVDCDACAGTDFEKDLFKAIGMAKENLPAVIAFDEFEGCAPPISMVVPDTRAAIQSRRVRRYAGEREIREKTLILCISNYPHIIELSTAGNFDSVIYFNHTDEQAIAEIIQNYLEIDDAMRAAKLLIDKRHKLGFTTLSYNVLKACQRLSKEKEQLETMPIETIVQRLECVCGPGATLKQAQEYEENYKEWIDFAQKQQEWYGQQALEIISELKSKSEPESQ